MHIYIPQRSCSGLIYKPFLLPPVGGDICQRMKFPKSVLKSVSPLFLLSDDFGVPTTLCDIKVAHVHIWRALVPNGLGQCQCVVWGKRQVLRLRSGLIKRRTDGRAHYYEFLVGVFTDRGWQSRLRATSCPLIKACKPLSYSIDNAVAAHSDHDTRDDARHAPPPPRAPQRAPTCPPPLAQMLGDVQPRLVLSCFGVWLLVDLISHDLISC